MDVGQSGSFPYHSRDEREPLPNADDAYMVRLAWGSHLFAVLSGFIPAR